MEKQTLLSITIPTYNRRTFLEQTLNVLTPQITDEVEIIVIDNHSSDDTFEYMQTMSGKIKYIRQEYNVGADRNMLSCMAEGSGVYFWLLCDDDLPCSNTVAHILNALKDFPNAPMFYLRVKGSDKNISNYDDKPVETSWSSFNANAFLNIVSFLFTFASSIVVKRDCVDVPFIQRQVDTGLVPAALVLSTVGKYDNGIISDRVLLYGRGDNSGGYNAIHVFSKNIIRLFQACDKRWFNSQTLHKTYNDNLAFPVVIVIQGWPLSLHGMGTMIRYSYRYSSFYKFVVPSLVRRILKQYVLKRNTALSISS